MKTKSLSLKYPINIGLAFLISSYVYLTNSNTSPFNITLSIELMKLFKIFIRYKVEDKLSKQNTRDKGYESEALAVKYLEEKNFKIIKQNFTFGRIGEIDIIAEDGDVLVFVEVKSTQTTLYGNPLEYITPKKQANLRRVAEGYLYVNKIYDKSCRFDVITIDYTKKEPEILHLIQAI